MRRPFLIFTYTSCFIGFLLLGSPATQAQYNKGDLGLGLQGGKPTGITLTSYNPRGMSFDLLGAWDLEDFYFVNVHGLFSANLGNSGNVRFMYGPGAFAGITDLEGTEDKVELGLSGSVGLSFLISKLELYGRFTPRLQLTNETQADMGGGVGLRFYF